MSQTIFSAPLFYSILQKTLVRRMHRLAVSCNIRLSCVPDRSGGGDSEKKQHVDFTFRVVNV